MKDKEILQLLFGVNLLIASIYMLTVYGSPVILVSFACLHSACWIIEKIVADIINRRKNK